MAKGTSRDREKEAAWRQRLEQHARSGQSVRAWCRQHRVTETAFYWWRRELARRDAESPATSLMPVHVAEDLARDVDPRIEIVLTDGRRVQVHGTVDPGSLAAVLNVLERRAC
jgi:transposase-like protein